MSETAEAITVSQGNPVAEQKSVSQAAILRDEAGLCLTDGTMVVRGDFTKMLPRLKPGKLQQELLVKAAKLKHAKGPSPLAIDATAGLGEDSLLLAAAGFRVRMYEYNETIAALLQDALERAADNPELAPIVARMELVQGDSIAAMQELAAQTDDREEIPDVVLLDPMFPERQKSASVKKKFQLLHHLERPCGDEAEMLQAALSSGAKKVVIKRPVKGAYLADRKPDYSLKGKAIRYDVIVVPR